MAIFLSQFRKAKRKPSIILQGEMSECGLCCLCMVFAAYRHEINITAMRKMQAVTLSGMSVADLVNIAKKNKFEPKVYRLEVDELHTLILPAILHWDLNHFVVLVAIKRNKVIIHDPACGRRVMTMSELSLHFTGVAVELKPGSDFKPLCIKESLSLYQFLKGGRQVKFILSQIFLLALLLQMFSLISPLYIQKLVDRIGMTPSVNKLIILAALFAGLKLIEVGIDNLRSYVIIKFGASLSKRLGLALVSHLLRLPLTFFMKRYTGDLISRFACIDKVRHIVAEGMVEAIVGGLMSIATMIVLFYYNVYMGLVSLVFSVFYLLVRLFMLNRFRCNNDRVIKCGALQNSYFIETLRGIQPIKLFANEDVRLKHWLVKYESYLNASSDSSFSTSNFSTVRKALFGVELILIVLLGGISIVANHFTVGMLYAFIFYRNLFSAATGSFVDKLIEYKLLALYLDRISDILLEKSELNCGASIISSVSSFRVEGLKFSYGEGRKPLFSNLSFTVEKNKTLVLVAPSGFGKTTLLKILIGLLRPTDGQVYVNNIDLQQVDSQSYRQIIGTVMQDDILFAGNLYQNISFFAESVDEEKVIRCAQLAGIHDEILTMPMQYFTLVGDMGTTLSGGQIQRVLLARALYSEPQILFLDEATSHLDQETERLINQKLKALPITKIIAAHRLETIRLADSVIDLRRAL